MRVTLVVLVLLLGLLSGRLLGHVELGHLLTVMEARTATVQARADSTVQACWAVEQVALAVQGARWREVWLGDSLVGYWLVPQ